MSKDLFLCELCGDEKEFLFQGKSGKMVCSSCLNKESPPNQIEQKSENKEESKKPLQSLTNRKRNKYFSIRMSEKDQQIEALTKEVIFLREENKIFKNLLNSKESEQFEEALKLKKIEQKQLKGKRD